MKNTLCLTLLLFFLFSCNQNKKSLTLNTLPASNDTTVAEITLLFVGDVMQHKPQVRAAKTETGYNYKECFQHIQKELNQADLAIANLETTLGGKPFKGYPLFSSPDELAFDLQKTGFNVFQLANNHILDRGKKGLNRTLHLLDSLQVYHTGAFSSEEDRMKRNPLFIEKKGFKLAFLNYTYGTNGLTITAPNIVNYIDKKVMEQDINKAKQNNPDAIIALLHWGEEYHQRPSKSQKELAEWLINQGVHHIIGSHPHVIQPLEIISDSQTKEKKTIAYSLGNFISNMSRTHTDGGMMLKLTLAKDSTTYLKSYEYNLVWTGRPIITNKQNYIVYPTTHSEFELNKQSSELRNLFLANTRNLLNKYNKGAIEYFIE